MKKIPKGSDFVIELGKFMDEAREQHPALSKDKAFVFWFVQAFLTENPTIGERVKSHIPTVRK